MGRQVEYRGLNILNWGKTVEWKIGKRKVERKKITYRKVDEDFNLQYSVLFLIQSKIVQLMKKYLH